MQTSGRIPRGLQWFWNPRQTGGPNEPDLLGEKDGECIVSGEVTSSDEPKGVIPKRMEATLEKLSRFEGKRFYLVRTAAMKGKAEAIVRNNGLPIEVVCLQNGL